MEVQTALIWGIVFFLAGIYLPLLSLASFLLALAIGASFVWRKGFIVVLLLAAFILGVFRGQEPFRASLLEKVSAPLVLVKNSFEANIVRLLPEPHGAYLAGLLIGSRTAIPFALKNAFRRTGTTHIIALSGYNVTIIASYLGKISGGMTLPIVGIVAFVLSTGASSSVVRAGIMGVFAYLARHHGYEYSAKNALFAAVAFMIALNPPILFGDIGFQLSVLATLGLVFLLPKIEPRLFWIPKRLGLREAAGATLAAEVATLPLTIFYFGFFSPLAPLVNVLVLPTIPPTMFFGFLGGLVMYMSTPLALIAAWPAYLLLSYQLFIIQFFASITLF